MSPSPNPQDPFTGVMGAGRGRATHEDARPARTQSTTEERMRRFADEVLVFGASRSAVRTLGLTHRLRVNRRASTRRGHHGPTLVLEDRENPQASPALLITDIVRGLDGSDPADVDLIERVRLYRLDYEVAR